MSDSLQAYGLQPTKFLCPWHCPGKNTGVGCHDLHQGILPSQGSNLHFLHILFCGFFTTQPPGMPQTFLISRLCFLFSFLIFFFPKEAASLSYKTVVLGRKTKHQLCLSLWENCIRGKKLLTSEGTYLLLQTATREQLGRREEQRIFSAVSSLKVSSTVHVTSTSLYQTEHIHMTILTFNGASQKVTLFLTTICQKKAWGVYYNVSEEKNIHRAVSAIR